MLDIDYSAHNREADEVWAAYRTGKPTRPPVFLGINVRYLLLSPWLNPRGITFQEYSEDPDLMLETQLEFLDYVYHNLLQDSHMGPPNEAWTGCKVDLQNYYDAAWYGCPVRFYPGQVPDAEPILHDDNKRMLLDRGIPDPFRDGVMAKNLEFYERMTERAKTLTYKGLPVTNVQPAGLNSDGPFTTAASLRGATELCIDVYEDPGYVHELVSYLTDAAIYRIKSWRKLIGQEEPPQGWAFADDSCQLLSVEMYREFLLPHHRRLIAELSTPGPNAIHLCGDAAHLFPTLREELNIQSFDTGFPIDFARVRAELGPLVEIKGGPSIQFLATATPGQVREEVKRILSSGVTEGGRFILREGNNLAPGTPEENVNAMHYAVREFGRSC